MRRMRTLALLGLGLAVSCNGQVQIDSEGALGDPAQRTCDRDSPALPVGDGWSTNPPECPATAPEVPGPCAGPEGLFCAYLGEDDRRVSPTQGVLSPRFTECGCFADYDSELSWYCFREGGQASVEGYAPSAVLGYDQCPAEAPVHWESCEGYAQHLSCPVVPDGECRCENIGGGDVPNGPIWMCSDLSDHFPFAPELPDGLDQARPVNELSSAEREGWCQWFQEVPGEIDAPNPSGWLGEVSKGMASYEGCDFGVDFPCRGSMPRLTQAHCEQNLALSQCAASLAELSDCVRTMARACRPAPSGCARYLEQPGCYGTIITPVSCEHLDLCSVRIE